MKKATILLVEDDPFLRDAFKLLLEDAGYRVTEAGTAQEAVESIASDLPSLVLLDLGLPDRPGLEVVRELRAEEKTRDLTIVALTGRVGPAEQQECLDAGCTYYLSKPIEPRELLRRLPEMLE
jgi:two-component system phosphate regulon response regulator PhoB